MAKVFVKFPKTGLGNLLLIWSRARLFASLNNFPLVTTPWWGLRWGVWLRNERKKRTYLGYFKENNFIDRVKVKWYSLSAAIINDPCTKKINNHDPSQKELFIFSKISIGNDLFSEIREYRDFIRDEIYKMLTPSMLKKMSVYQHPVIAVHIRRGDFILGNPITPLSFFIDCIKSIRSISREDLPVTVFTDAHESELKEILLLPGIKVAENKPDILDILLMSKASIVVLSQSSTFSYWAAFLSDAVVLRPYNDWQNVLRSDTLNKQFPEMKWKEGDAVCLQELKQAISNLSYKDSL